MLARSTTSTDATAWPVQLLRGLAVTIAAVIVAYFFIDLPVCCFLRDWELHHYRVLRWLTRPPEVFCLLSPLVLIAGLLRRWFGPWTPPEKAAVAAAVATLFAALTALLLKIAFGRSGPHLVSTDIASSLSGGIYGFYPFTVSYAYWALPSGHTACTLSATCVLAAAFPSQRLVWGLIGVIVPAALVALNHHFVGDVLAGAYVGWAIAGTVVRQLDVGTAECRLSP